MQTKAATVITAFAAWFTAAMLFHFFATDIYAPGGSTDDSGAVQGFALVSGALLVAALAATAVFPAAAVWLERRGTFTWSRWTHRMLGAVALLSLLASASCVLALGGSLLDGAEIVTFSVLFWCIATVFLIPFSCMWRALVTCITNRSTRSRAKTRAPG